MATRAEVVAAARSLVEPTTPYMAKARLPGVGIDCIGVPEWTAVSTGLKPPDFSIGDYDMTPDGSLIPRCREHMTPIQRSAMQPGDVVIVRWGNEPHHVGIVGDWRHGGLSMIHAENYRHHKVIEHRLWFDGAMKFVAAFSIPGIEP